MKTYGLWSHFGVVRGNKEGRRFGDWSAESPFDLPRLFASIIQGHTLRYYKVYYIVDGNRCVDWKELPK